MKRYLLIFAPIAGILSGGFVWLMSYCFGLGWTTVGACLLAGIMDWCLVEIAISAVKYERGE